MNSGGHSVWLRADELAADNSGPFTVTSAELRRSLTQYSGAHYWGLLSTRLAWIGFKLNHNRSDNQPNLARAIGTVGGKE